jgi:ribosomal protein S18 acetylase RimI-like enzyme
MKTVDRDRVKIRRMVGSDINPTLSIWWANIPEKEMVATQLQGPLNLSFIAEYDGFVVGFVLAALIHAGYPMSGMGVVYLIEVSPDYQKGGIGTMLIDALEKYCNSKGINVIRACVHDNDENMIKYFTKAGFCRSNVINFDKPCPVK